MKKNVFFIGLIFILLLSACSNKEGQVELLDQPYSKTEFLMGTVVTLKVYDKGKEQAIDKSFDRIKTLAAEITTSDAGKSEIDKVNQNAGIKPVEVTPDMFYLVKEGIQYSKASFGDFDITVGPLTDLWHIGFPDAKKPTEAEIKQVLPLIDYKKVEMNEANQTIYLPEKGMALDLGGIAKGYIADEVNKVMKKQGVTSAIIDLGGNIFVRGDNPKGGDWTIGIQNPFEARGKSIGKLPGSDVSVVTSGIYERYLELDGVKYHHILSPFTGYPFNNELAGVSIVSKKSIDGDGLSTAVFIKGVKGGMDYVDTFSDVEAIFVTKDKKVYVTDGLKDQFKLTDKSFKMAELDEKGAK
ncbi:thiamine biosynthesis lipoprotein ApbE [Listeria fleischmannii 1991]|uniref:FAD:protein FMN transferase n=2 Tax=Listeria fleischmannii TaxID=1069827 RepID=A0A2X3H7Y5_9LIST|nr:FAD:protein FMN transferase [Listeria fleischmannii]KMT60219.1 thiamine biosynthesis lipoprotein ApbE [Listeria fleischmannii 1991]SQC68893.1 Thiamine biosynthesis lipoprotein ApbE precursor [Listeria fleischmannii subsp. fleischmannii]